MKIENIVTEVHLREQPQRVLRHDFPRLSMFGGKILKSGPETAQKVPYTIVKIITDDGIEGFSFGSRAIAEPIVSNIKPEIVGRDPLDREWIWQRLNYLHDRGRHMPFPYGAISAIDRALWDIAGKSFGVPIYKLLGAHRDKIQVYASSWGKETNQEYIDEALACKERGVPAYKIHPYWRTDEKDIETCRVVREAVGPDYKLMLDVGGHYSREEAFRVGKAIQDLNYYWFEEPLPDTDIEGLIQLRRKLDIPICATETTGNPFLIPQYIVRGAVDMVRCDAWLSGGITPTKKIADMCSLFGMMCEIHVSWFPPATVANLHVECAVKNSEFHEAMWPAWEYPVKGEPVLDSEGYIHVPQKPGLGIEIDEEALGQPIEKF